MGIVGGLFFTGWSLLIDAWVRRVQNLIALTSQHRELWDQLNANPELSRVADTTVDLNRHPVTAAEDRFVISVILHLSANHKAILAGMMSEPDGAARDVRKFFSLPIPQYVLQRNQAFLDRSVLRFIRENSDGADVPDRPGCKFRRRAS